MQNQSFVLDSAQKDHRDAGARWISILTLVLGLTATSMANDFNFGPANEVDRLGEVIIVERPLDINADGNMDLVASLASTNRVVYYESDGANPPHYSRQTLSILGNDPMEACPGDFDGDGYGDVLVSLPYENKAVWCRNNKTTPTGFTPYLILNSSDGPWATFAGDVNGDGVKEPLTGSLNDGKIYWYSPSNDPPYLAPHLVTSIAHGSIQLAVADLEGDGDPDILSANYYAGSFTWHENLNGLATQFADHVLQDNVAQAIKIQTADLDHDGDQDVITSSFQNNTFAWHENKGGQPPQFTRHSLPLPSGRYTVFFGIADLDADNDLDIVCGIPQLIILENDGGQPAQFTQQPFPGTPPNIGYVQVADMNRDGLTDVIVADATSSSAHRLVWFANQSAAPAVRVVAPNGGEIFPGDGSISVRWQADARVGESVRIELWNARGLVADLGEHPSAEGENNTAVPIPFEPPRGDYRIRVSSVAHPELIDESDAAFMIKGGVRIVSPNGGEVLAGGSEIQVQWRTDLDSAGTSVKLELWNAQGLVAELGNCWSADGVTTQTLYLPLVPGGGDYRLRAISLWNPQLRDESDGTFTINGTAVRVKRPYGGETWTSGTRAWVWWETNPQLVGTSVVLELWRGGHRVADLGSSWSPDGVGLAEVIVPNLEPADDYWVLAFSSWDMDIGDQSDGPITLLNDHWTGRTDVESAGWLLYE